MNSWEILGIGRTKDKKAIKRAYATKLAMYHPEDEPEKFLEIQQAYKRAIEYASTFAERSVVDNNEDKSDIANMGNDESDIKQKAKNDTKNDKTNNIDKIDTIFNTTTTENYAEGYSEDKFLPAKALMEMKIILESKEISKLRTFVNSDIFGIVKVNPLFIKSLTTLLPNYDISNKHINLLRNYLGIKNRTSHSYIYHSELNEELDKLESHLNERYQRIVPFIIVAIVIILIYVSTMLFIPIETLPNLP